MLSLRSGGGRKGPGAGEGARPLEGAAVAADRRCDLGRLVRRDGARTHPPPSVHQLVHPSHLLPPFQLSPPPGPWRRQVLLAGWCGGRLASGSRSRWQLVATAMLLVCTAWPVRLVAATGIAAGLAPPAWLAAAAASLPPSLAPPAAAAAGLATTTVGRGLLWAGERTPDQRTLLRHCTESPLSNETRVSLPVLQGWLGWPRRGQCWPGRPGRSGTTGCWALRWCWPRRLRPVACTRGSGGLSASTAWPGRRSWCMVCRTRR